MTTHPYHYSVIVPVYNSEKSLKTLYERLEKVFEGLGVSWEGIFVNDASHDASWKVLKELTKNNTNITAVNLSNNFGQHNALMCGFAYATGGHVITMDDDLQHPPEEIPKLIQAVTEKNTSVVYGQYVSKQHGWFRDLCSKYINTLISRITGSGYMVTSFRIIENAVVKKLTRFTQYNVMIDVLIKDLVSRNDVGHVMVAHHPREIGTSNYSYRKLIAYALNMIFNYTLWPLRLGTMVGLVLAVCSVFLGLYFLVDYFIHKIPVAGFTSLMVVMTFLFGTILFVLGIIGEYMGRVFLNINQKPQYSIKETLGKISRPSEPLHRKYGAFGGRHRGVFLDKESAGADTDLLSIPARQSRGD